MATPIYTYAQLKSRINSGIKGKVGILVDARETINEVVREVVSDIDLRSTRRKSALTPKLFSRIFEYASPTDIKGSAIIDIQNQTGGFQKDYTLVGFEQFSRRQDTDTVAFDDSDFIKKILINAQVNSLSTTVSALDSLTSGGGTWVVYSTGSENLVADSDDYVRENASLKFGISAISSTTAGIKNTGLSTTDMTQFLGGNGAAFVWAYINSTTNITNFILEIGTDSSNYYKKTITTASDGTAFRNGWNLLRFDLTTLTETGTVTDATINYAAIYMTKSTSKVSETDYRFDSLVLKKGEINNVHYYSKYGWQTSGGTYIENSTADSDLLMADTDEFNLMIQKGIEIAGMEVDENEAAEKAARKYEVKKKEYIQRNPSERMLMINTYADFIKQ